MTLEQAFDNEINPLIERIRLLCAEYGINWVAGFQLDEDDEGGVTMFAVSQLHNGAEATSNLVEASRAIRQQEEEPASIQIMMIGPFELGFPGGFSEN